MAKAGKIQHWKHGWIPLTAWARAQVAEHNKPKAEKDAERRARYEAHLKATAPQRAATRAHYEGAQERNAGKNAAMEQRYRDAQNRTTAAMRTTLTPDTPFLRSSPGPEGDPHTRGTKFDTPVESVGMTYSPAAAADPRVARLKNDRATWDAQPSYEYQLDGAKLLATEEFLRSKPINKVVGGEPFREGYDPEILRTDEGDIVIDGHHRVAMHQALGNQSMSAKIIDVRGGASVDEAAAEGAEIKRLADDIMAKAKTAEPTTTKVLSDTAERAGGRMQSLDHRLKTPTSLARKLRDKAAAKGLTPEQYAPKLNDALRYTMVTPASTYTQSVQSVLADFRSRGYQVDEIKNTWPYAIDYKGINTTLVTPEGLPFELQFHTEESLRAKSAQHKDFELARDPSVPLRIRKDALNRMVVNMSLIARPTGVDAIPSTVEVKSSVVL